MRPWSARSRRSWLTWRRWRIRWVAVRSCWTTYRLRSIVGRTPAKTSRCSLLRFSETCSCRQPSSPISASSTITIVNCWATCGAATSQITASNSESILRMERTQLSAYFLVGAEDSHLIYVTTPSMTLPISSKHTLPKYYSYTFLTILLSHGCLWISQFAWVHHFESKSNFLLPKFSVGFTTLSFAFLQFLWLFVHF